MTTLFLDADACPVRDEAFRVSTRLGIPCTVVSNGSRPIRPPGLPLVRMVIVPEGADAADDWIAGQIGPGDVCATADIPLASRCLKAGALALDWKGRAWTEDNIGSALAGREVARHLREIGAATGGPAPLAASDRSRFLSTLDTLCRKAMVRSAAPQQEPGPPR